MYTDLLTSLAAQHTADLRREASADRARAVARASVDRCLTLAARLRASARTRVAALRPGAPAPCSTC